jgi:hypothetical protein
MSRDAATVAFFNRKTSDGNIIDFRKDGSPVGSIGASGGDLIVGTGDTGLYFYDGADTIIPWNISSNSSRNGSIDLGASSHRFKNLYLSGGVHLGGTGAANKLDDYEEVSFTATIKGGAAEPSTLITATGFATKIGRVVQYTIGYENVDTTGYSGLVSFTGLPFTNNGGRAIGNIVGYLGLTFTNTDSFSVIGVNTTTIEALNISSNSSWANSTHNAGSGRYFWLTGTYLTTA